MTYEDTGLFFYVENGIIAPPPQEYIFSPDEVRFAPFTRPLRIGDTIIGENTPDSVLEILGVYRLWYYQTEQPANTVRMESAPQLVDGTLVKTDIFRAKTAEEQRAEKRDEAESKYNTALKELQAQAALAYFGINDDYDAGWVENLKTTIQEARAVLNGDQ